MPTTIRHRSTCSQSQPLSTRLGQDGDVKTRCPECQARGMVTTPRPLPAPYVVPCVECGTLIPHGAARPAVRYCHQPCEPPR